MRLQATFLTLGLVLLSACGGGSGSGSNAAQGSKSLFSLWSGPSTSLNMTNLHFGPSQAIAWVVNPAIGATCDATVFINGTNSSGSASITNSHWAGGGSGDPGCASLNNSYSYSNDGTTLSVCAQTCQTFQ